MGVLTVILEVLLLIAALFMIVTVLLQSSNQRGLGAIAGGAETFFGKNKAPWKRSLRWAPRLPPPYSLC